MNKDRIILPITPQPWINFNSGKGSSDVAVLFIPEECSFKHRVTKDEKDKGVPCDEYLATGKCPHILSIWGQRRKKAIERYNKYRMDVYHLAKKAGLKVPSYGVSLYFHFPMPIRWNKTKRAMMFGQPHLSTPDVDNCTSAIFDALLAKDEGAAQLSGVGKFWTDKEVGFTEILLNQPVYNPYGVEFLSLPLLDLCSYEEKRKQRQARKAELEKEREKLAKRNPKPVNLIKKYKKLTDELK